MNEKLVELDQARSAITDLAVRFAPKLLVAIVIVVVGYFVARWLSRPADRLFASLHIDLAVRQFLTRAVRGLVLLVFVIMALQNLGVELLPLIAGLGIVGAGVALAMQGVLGDLVAGLSILFRRPFRIGEYISVVGEEGEVVEINLFATVLKHNDRSRVMLPNRKIVGEVLHNYGDIRQLDLAVGVAYDTPLEEALALVGKVVAANPRVLKDPAPVIGVAALDDSSIGISVRPWVQVGDFGPAGAEIYQALVKELRANDIEIPFPQREVRLLEKD
jgi:small conductance mechanosensitive channel